MKVKVVITTGSDGYFSCYVKNDFDGFALFGYGETAAKAKSDLQQSYAEIREMMEAEGKSVPELEFEWHYDMKAFFNYFDFLNVSKVAKAAGINPSLMRKYAAGIVNPGETNYRKLYSAIQSMVGELAVAAS